MANLNLLKVSLLGGCLLLGVLGYPNQSVNNEGEVNDEHGDAQDNLNNTGTHPAGKSDCSGNALAVGDPCNNNTGVCMYRADKYGNEGHKQCVGYCGDALPEGPDNSEIVLPVGWDVDNPTNWIFMTAGKSFDFACDAGYSSTCGYTEVVCLPSGEWSELAFECKRDCGEPEVASPMTVDDWSGTLEGDIAVTECPGDMLAVDGNSLTCVVNPATDTAEWVGGGSCVEVCDEDVEEIDNANANQDADYYVVGGEVTYDCADGYYGCPSVICEAGGDWGTVSGSCQQGCKASDLDSIPHGTVDAGNTLYELGAIVGYECDNGYGGSPTRECEANGQWSAASESCRIDCGQPQVSAPATLDSTSGTLEGDMATITCPVGQMSVNGDSLTCTAAGDWTGSQSCVEVCDDDVEQIDNANANQDADYYVVGVEVTYDCADGYYGSPSVICEAGGDWGAVSGSCQQGCKASDLDSIPHGTVDAGNTLYELGAIVGYECDNGYGGSPTRECETNGQWSAVSETCRIDCGQPPVTAPATLDSTSGTLEGDMATITCPDGQMSVNGDSLTCTAAGTWAGSQSCVEVCDKDDVPTSAPATADVDADYYVINAEVSYDCPSGYAGCPSTTCISGGNWSPVSGSCQKICDAGAIPSINDADQTAGTPVANYYLNAVVLFECKDGFTGSPYQQCVDDGAGGVTWEQKGGCVAVPHDCGPFTDTVDYATQTSADPCDTEEGATVVWNCDYSEATVTYTCTAENDWTTPDSPCPEPVCNVDDLEDIANSNYVANATPYKAGDTVAYTCTGDYTGGIIVICLDDGTWSTPAGECSPPDPTVCYSAVLPNIDNTNHNGDASTYDVGQVITYTCINGNTGTITTICQGDGTWGPTVGVCTPDPTVCYSAVLPNIDNTNHNGDASTYDVGQVITYTCINGNTGTITTICQGDGTWGPTVGVCTPDPTVCYSAVLPNIDNTNHNGDASTYDVGQVITYTCINGNTGTITTICQGDGTWGPTVGVCTPDPQTCDDPEFFYDGLMLENVDISPTDTGARTAYYKCCPGCDTFFVRTCDASTGYDSYSNGTACAARSPCDVSDLTTRSSDQNGYSFEGCCYYATQAEKNLELGSASVANTAEGYCGIDVAGMETALAIPETTEEYDFLRQILKENNLAVFVWSGYKYEGGQLIDIVTDQPTTFLNSFTIRLDDGPLVEGICLGLDSSSGEFFTTTCDAAKDKHKGVCKVCGEEPTP